MPGDEVWRCSRVTRLRASDRRADDPRVPWEAQDSGLHSLFYFWQVSYSRTPVMSRPKLFDTVFALDFLPKWRYSLHWSFSDRYYELNHASPTGTVCSRRPFRWLKFEKSHWSALHAFASGLDKMSVLVHEDLDFQVPLLRKTSPDCGGGAFWVSGSWHLITFSFVFKAPLFSDRLHYSRSVL